jgi:hypothetical protein
MSTTILAVFLLIGDSIGLGTYSNDARTTVPYLLTRASRGQWLVLNYSIGGEAFGGNLFTGHRPNGYEAWATHAIPIIELGVNDWGSGTDLERFTTAYDTFLSQATAWGQRAYCLTPIWTAYEAQPNRLGLLVEDYRAVIRTVCQVRGARILEGRTLVPADPRYYVDGIHPNALGARALGRGMITALRAAGE